jgi:UDPglucose 6-dehydrogenase
MRIVIIGTGYVGLVTGACYAEMGHTVICLDIDEIKIANLKLEIIPIYEPGLEELVKRNVAQKRLFFTTDYKEGISNSDLCFIAVSTPSKEDGSCDTSFVEAAARSIAEHMDSYKIIVNKSTVPVGTSALITEWIHDELQKKGASTSFDVASNPEFLREGAAIQDCLKPDRILIGSNSVNATATLKKLYASFSFDEEKILIMDVRSAEMTKFAANAMLATRISFMNELAEICKKVGANINEVRKGIGSDSRIGYDFLYSGVGFGGSCFPKDLRTLISTGKQTGSKTAILQAVVDVNNQQKKWIGNKLTAYFKTKGGLLGKRIALWGLSFKPDTDDIREAPSLDAIEYILSQGAYLQIFDPIAMPTGKKYFKNTANISWYESELDAATDADAVILVTEWKQFQFIDFKMIKEKMNGKAFFDGRNQYKVSEMRNKGFDYFCIGIPDDQDE